MTASLLALIKYEQATERDEGDLYANIETLCKLDVRFSRELGRFSHSLDQGNADAFQATQLAIMFASRADQMRLKPTPSATRLFKLAITCPDTADHLSKFIPESFEV